MGLGATFGPLQHMSAVWVVLWQCGQGAYVLAFGLSVVCFSLSFLFFTDAFPAMLKDMSSFSGISATYLLLFGVLKLSLFVQSCCCCCCNRGNR